MWLGVDPLAEKYPGVSPYVYCTGNPVKYVDPDGREACDDEGTYISDAGNNLGIDFVYTKNVKDDSYIIDNKGNTISFNDNNKTGLDMRGEVRTNDCNWKDITYEFLTETGPERSLFEGNHPANESILNHYLFQQAKQKFIASGNDKMSIPVNWNEKDIVKTGSGNNQAQMMGSYTASFYKLGDKTLSIVRDSKSMTSLFFHLGFVKNKDRADGGNTTYQNYIFYVK